MCVNDLMEANHAPQNIRLPPCRICGEKASGFHYGVNSCGACKGFFLRSLARRSHPYTCAGNGQCNIGPETKRRKSCQKCRFDKCLTLGMSKDAIKIGRYTYSKRTQDTLELKNIQFSDEGSKSKVNLPDKTSHQPMTHSGLSQSTMDLDLPTEHHTDDSDSVSADTYSSGYYYNDRRSSSSPSSAILHTRSDKTFSLSPDQVSFYSSSSPEIGGPLASNQSNLSSMSSTLNTPMPLTPPTAASDYTCSLPPCQDGQEKDSLGGSFSSNCFAMINFQSEKRHNSYVHPEDIDVGDEMERYDVSALKIPIVEKKRYSSDHEDLSLFGSQSEFAKHTRSSALPLSKRSNIDSKSQYRHAPYFSHQAYNSSIPYHPAEDQALNLIKNVEADSNSDSNQPSPFQIRTEELLPLSKILSDSISGQHLNAMPLVMKAPATSDSERSREFPILRGQSYAEDLMDLRMSKDSLHQQQMQKGDSLIETQNSNTSSPLDLISTHQAGSNPQSSFGDTEKTDRNQNQSPTVNMSFVELLSKKQSSKSSPRQKLESLKEVLAGNRLRPHSILDMFGKSTAKQTSDNDDGNSNKSEGTSSSSEPLDFGSQSRAGLQLSGSSSQVPDKDKPQTWDPEFSVSELESLIDYLVRYHKENVLDNNSHEDVLQEKHTYKSELFGLEQKHFGALKALDWNMYFDVYKSTGLDVDGRIDPLSHFLMGFQHECVTAINFIKKIPGFKQLPLGDQAKLVRGSAHEFQLLSNYKGWDNEMRQCTFLSLKGLTLTEQDMKKMFNPAAFENHTSMATRLQALKLTFEQTVILKAIVVMAPDREDIEARHTVGHIYWKLINCLLYLLWRQTDKPNTHFSDIMSIVSELRSYSLIIRQAYIDVRDNIEMITKHIDIPYVYDIFF